MLGRAAGRHGSCCGGPPGIDCADFYKGKKPQRYHERRQWEKDEMGIEATGGAFAAGTRIDPSWFRDLFPPGWQPASRLVEHGPEEDDRWCRSHYDPEGLFGRHRHRRGKCWECETEGHEEWLEDIRVRLGYVLRDIQQGVPAAWGPDERELILTRMTDLEGAPETFAATTAWVHKHLDGTEE